MEQIYEWGDRNNSTIVFLHGHSGESPLADEEGYLLTRLAKHNKKYLD